MSCADRKASFDIQPGVCVASVPRFAELSTLVRELAFYEVDEAPYVLLGLYGYDCVGTKHGVTTRP